MNKKFISIIGILVLVALSTGAYLTFTNSEKTSSEPQAAQIVQANTNSDTYKQYAAMTGETYDRNFIANMIAHHQGAIDMAKLAQTTAKHVELKTMADNIVRAQEKEKADLLAWQKEWGYPSTSADDMQDHAAMGMMDSMSGMLTALEGKSGDDFDKAFMEQMIIHHQGALDMAAPGKENALRQEIKDLSSAIVNDQMKEIAQMQTWQKEWGYSN